MTFGCRKRYEGCMDLDQLGHVLRTRRMDLGKTLAEVGGHAGCTRQNVYKVEKALSNPTVNTLDRIADGLALDLHLLVLPRGEGEADAQLVGELLTRLGMGDEALVAALRSLLGAGAKPAAASRG